MPVANYWKLNQIYVIITAFVIICALILYSVLFIQFQIDVSKDLNGHCENQIAMYFDKTSRDRCLTEKITKKNELSGLTKEFEKNMKTANQNINTLNKKIRETDEYYKSLQSKEFPEIKRVQNMYEQLQSLVEKINLSYDGIENQIGTLKTDFETSVNNNVQFAIDLGNNLVDTLVKNTYTKKWKDKREQLVDSYNKIKGYLNDKNIQPYLVKISENSENLDKINKINTGFSNKVKTGPK